jgi:hypothetical protein
MDSMESRRAILAKSPPPNQPTSPSATTPAISTTPRSTLQYPSIKVPGSSSTSASSPKSSFEYGSSPPRTSIKFGSFFKSFRGRSAFDADDDEFDGARKYSTSTLKKEESITDSSPGNTSAKSKLHHADFFKIDGGRAYCSPSPYPSATPSPAKPKPLANNFFVSFNGRSAFDADDDEFDDQRKYTIEASSPTASTRSRAISWANQVAYANSAAFDDVSERAGRGEDGHKSSSTVSVTSTFEPTPFAAQHSTTTSRQNYKTIRKSQGKLMSATLKAARGISPYQGNMWDPEEDEWMDASKVVETFKASYKTPVPALPSATQGALSYFGTAIQSTVKSVLGSAALKKREEERIEEEVREKVEDLGNTCLYDPKGDANDEVMKSVFLSPTRFFPGHAVESPRSMHIVDLNAYFQSFDPLIANARPRLCDAIATVLSHTSKGCLEAFLNPSIKEFIYRRKVDNNEGGMILIIRREGNEVVCGVYHNFAFKKLWKLYVKSVISITGQWHEVFATLKPGEMIINKGVPEWGTIQPEQSELKSDRADAKTTENTQRKLELSPTKKIAKASDEVKETDPKFMLYQSRVLALYLLWDIWYRFDKMYECRATWMTDGEEMEVRLKRMLVDSDDEKDD